MPSKTVELFLGLEVFLYLGESLEYLEVIDLFRGKFFPSNATLVRKGTRLEN